MHPSGLSTDHRRLLVWIAVLVPVLVGATCATDAATLSGRLFDPAGAPVPGATVRVLADGLPVGEALSDDRGLFSLADLPEGTLRLQVSADGLEPVDSVLDLPPSGLFRTLRLGLATIESRIEVTADLPELPTLVEVAGDVLARSPEADLGGALRSIAGVSAVRRGPINLDPNVRGLQETQVAVLVDGTRTAAAGPGRMDSELSHVGPHALESLRVVKGPYALAWGSGTLSAISVETVPARFSAGGFGWRGSSSLAWAENGDRTDGHVALGGGDERFAFHLDVGHRVGDDFEAGDGTEVPGDYESTDTRFDLRFQHPGGWLVGLNGGYQEQFDIDYPGRMLDATYFYTRSLRAEILRSGRTQVLGQLFTNRKDHLMNNDEKPSAQPMPGRMPPLGLLVEVTTESNTTGGRFHAGREIGPMEWTVGSDVLRTEQNAAREIRRRADEQLLFRDVIWPDARIDEVGLWVRGVRRFDRATLAATIRGDFVDASSGTPSEFFLENASADTDASENELGGAVSLVGNVGPHIEVKAGLGRVSRSATALERYSDRFPSSRFQLAAELMGDPQLDPETSTELDLGLASRSGGFRFELDLFAREIDDYITFVPDPSLPARLPMSPPTVFRYVNGSRATFYGGEAVLAQTVPLQGGIELDWRAELDVVRARDHELDEPVLGIPPLSLQTRLRLRALDRRLSFQLAVRAVDRQDRVSVTRSEQETPGHTTFDLGGRWQPTERWAVDLLVSNVTDRAYADHLDSPNPFTGERILERGRDVRLGLELRF